MTGAASAQLTIDKPGYSGAFNQIRWLSPEWNSTMRPMTGISDDYTINPGDPINDTPTKANPPSYNLNCATEGCTLPFTVDVWIFSPLDGDSFTADYLFLDSYNLRGTCSVTLEYAIKAFADITVFWDVNVNGVYDVGVDIPVQGVSGSVQVSMGMMYSCTSDAAGLCSISAIDHNPSGSTVITMDPSTQALPFSSFSPQSMAPNGMDFDNAGQRAETMTYNDEFTLECGLVEKIIEVYGVPGAYVEIADQDFTPTPADNTDFGTINSFLKRNHTFNIQNNYPSFDITISQILIADTTAFSLAFDPTPVSLGAVSASATNQNFTIIFDPPDDVRQTYTTRVTIVHDDPATSGFYQFDITGIASEGTIDVFGNSILIPPDASNTPMTNDFTDYGDVTIGSMATRTYTIVNSGTETLNINSIAFSEAEFSLVSGPSSIAPTSSATFEVSFQPVNGDYVDAVVTISHDAPDPGSNPYQFNVRGLGCPAVPTYEIQCDSPGACTCILCEGGTATLNANALTVGFSYVPADEYVWTHVPTGTTTVTMSSTLVNAEAGLYRLRVNTATPQCDLSVQDTFDVTEPDALHATIARQCTSQGMRLTAIGSGGCPAYGFDWTTVDGTLPDGNTDSEQHPVTDMGTYDVTVDDQQGCTASDDTFVQPIRVGSGKLNMLEFTPEDASLWSLTGDLVEYVGAESDGLQLLFSDFDGVQTSALSFDAGFGANAITENGYFGVALGIDPSNPNNYLLVDWNYASTPLNGFPPNSPTPMLRLSRISGTASDQELWSKTGPDVTVLATASGGGDPAGPYQMQDYRIYIDYLPNSVQVFVDGVLQLEYTSLAALPDGNIAFIGFASNGVQYKDARRIRRGDGGQLELCDRRNVTVSVLAVDEAYCGQAVPGYILDIYWGDGSSDIGTPLTFPIALGGVVRIQATHEYAATGTYFVDVCVRVNGDAQSEDCHSIRVRFDAVTYRILQPSDLSVWYWYAEYQIQWDAGVSPPDNFVRIELTPAQGYGAPEILALSHPIGVDVNAFNYMPRRINPGMYNLRLSSVPGGCAFAPSVLRINVLSQDTHTGK